MKQLLLIIAAASLTATLPHFPHPPAATAAHPPSAKVAPIPSATVVFFDDFNTGHLDRSKWNVEITGMHVNNELQAYVDSAKTLYEENGS
jgi:hypothetical protein